MQNFSIPQTISSTQKQIFAFGLLAVVVFFSCLLGIFTRPLSYFSFFWPSNALLLGLLIRFPSLKSFGGILGAFFGYMGADLVTDNTFLMTLGLTLSNFVAVFSGLFFFNFARAKLPASNNNVSELYPHIIAVTLGCFFWALFVILLLPNLPHTFMLKENRWIDFFTWWSGEILNAVIVLPLILAAPGWSKFKKLINNQYAKETQIQDILPFFALLISIACTHIFYGPGALLYPLAALIWAAASYQLFNLALINSLVCLTLYHSVTGLFIDQVNSSYLTTIISIRVGLIILGLATLILCVISQNRNQLYREVLYLANHDSLTETLNRRSFTQLSEKALKHKNNHSLSLIMLDIDDFKKMNDQYGHYVGDRALQHLSNIVKSNLRDHDLFCRIGGEEFIILLNNNNLNKTQRIAERIRMCIEHQALNLENLEPIHFTVSMGVSHTHLPTNLPLQDLIIQADQALYQAKMQGRNRVILAS